MKAVRVIEGVNDFVLQDVDAPALRQGGAIVRMEAAIVASYMAALPSGAWMTPPRPFIPGQCAIGIVRESSGGLAQGQRVYFDAYTGSRTSADPNMDHGFLGCFAVGPGAMRAMSEWPNGSFAEIIHAPEACFTPLPDLPYGPDVLCRLGWLGTALQGLEQGGFRAGMTVAINGATGLVGSGAVVLALALGAREVLVFGRRQTILDQLVSLDPARVTIGAIDDGTLVDLVLDCSSGSDASVTEALTARLARFGKIAFVGGLSAPATIDTAALMRNSNSLVGSYWFTQDVLDRIIGLLTSGVLRLDDFQAVSFALENIEDAIGHASRTAGGLTHTVLVP